MATSALLLSGGDSSRFGGYPKALVSTGERSGVRRMAEVALEEDLSPVVVVVGPHRRPIEDALKGLDVELVDSEDWHEGRTASVQAGLRAIPPAHDVLLWPVDHPFVDGRTIELLGAARDSDELGLWFIPTYRGESGHPVLWKNRVRSEVLELRADAPIRALIPELGPQVRRVAVEDPGILANIDTPEQYRQAYDAWLARRED
ncbi:MAG TPA: nucleotidyltransferase family protein [Thermoplasmata archaeon]|nr:nucleotidyltransferase family protein [Thermoplasmata archaeon]